jgi:type I restriction enzyme S subunit
VIVGHALASPRFPAFIEPDLTGVSVPHLSDEQIGNYRVPEIAARPTDAILELLDRRRKSSLKVEQCIRRQMDLLIEHRQALVTAAVTGELSIPGAAA